MQEILKSIFLISFVVTAFPVWAELGLLPADARKGYLIKSVSGPSFQVENEKGDEFELRLWALKMDESWSNDFFVDRVLSCLVLKVGDNDELVADCKAAPSKLSSLISVPPSEYWIDLFLWLPQLGRASQLCSDWDEVFVVDKITRLAYVCPSLSKSDTEKEQGDRPLRKKLLR